MILYLVVIIGLATFGYRLLSIALLIYKLYTCNKVYVHFIISKRSPQIEYSPVDEMESRGVKQGENFNNPNFDNPKNEDSNSSISNILRSVLRDEPSYPTQESVRR